MAPSQKVLNQLGNAGVHIIVLSTFWIVLYEKLAADIARDALKGQVDSAVQNAAAKVDSAYPILQTLHSSTTTTTTALSMPSQKKNRRYLLYLIGILSIVTGGLFWLNINYPGQIMWRQIFKDNALLFTGVGAIEYWFFTRIAQYYAPILPSDLAENTKERVLEYGNC